MPASYTKLEGPYIHIGMERELWKEIVRTKLYED